MHDVTRWDWESKVKTVADMEQWKNEFEAVYEPCVSHDGEKIASVVKTGEGEFNVSVNGVTWEEPYEKIWYLRFGPDDRLTALVSKDMEWTMGVDGETWEEGYEYKEYHINRPSELPLNFFGEFKIAKGMIIFETTSEPSYLGNADMMGSWPLYPEERIRVETVVRIKFDDRIAER